MTAEHCRSRRGGWRRGRQWAGKKERERRDRLVGKNKKPKICMSCRRTRSERTLRHSVAGLRVGGGGAGGGEEPPCCCWFESSGG